MSLEGGGRSVGKARHPVLLAVAVVAIILFAATAYTYVGSPSASDEAASGTPGGLSKVTLRTGASGLEH